MWIRALLIGILIGLTFIAFSINAQPALNEQEEVIKKLDQVLENQEKMFNYLHFIKNKV